jgi:hypothetical protein
MVDVGSGSKLVSGGDKAVVAHVIGDRKTLLIWLKKMT